MHRTETAAGPIVIFMALVLILVLVFYMPCFIKNNLFDFLLYLCQIAENFNENYPVCEKIFS